MSVLAPFDVAEHSKLQLRRRNFERTNIGATLDLSESRTYDCVLKILRAYKLTGNFPVNLEIVLKDLGFLDKVTFEIKPKAMFSDCRHVEFRPKHHVTDDHFDEILRSIKSRIEFELTPRLWARLFR
jgi:hypothetical protein